MSGSTLQSKEVAIALLGLFGVLTIAVLSNLDKITPGKGVVQSSYSGYQPTGDFETEFRYYYEVSGARKSIQLMVDGMLESIRVQVNAQHPNNTELFEKIVLVAKEEQTKFDDVMNASLPVYKNTSLSQKYKS